MFHGLLPSRYMQDQPPPLGLLITGIIISEIIIINTYLMSCMPGTLFRCFIIPKQRKIYEEGKLCL